ncbi:MAG TPA: 2-amino-4-hydroxy-6-hydroxymethyldihydropteridine diphosphokinase [Azospira sp.]|nr:2-amino-4-hydroxy-6-hydroxymethyldihydropteridine diphosphokinase [Azospira sp.]
MHRAFIALGANLEDPATQVRAALADLAATGGITLVRASSLYRTAPIGISGQPDFINAVAEVRTELGPDALLQQLFAVESHFGRVRSYRNAPRTLDLDLLLHDDIVLDTPDLILPHPRLHLRAFVLQPLAEIAPDLRLPRRGSIAAWLPAVANQRIEKL